MANTDDDNAGHEPAAEAASKAAPKPRRGRRALIAIAIGLLAALLLCEVALRVGFVSDGMFRGSRPLPPFGALTNPQQRQWLADWRGRDDADAKDAFGIGGFSIDIGWKMEPSRVSFDGRYRTGALSARGPKEYPETAEPGVLRLMTFGDSFTFCDEVGAEETWQHHLEQSIEAGGCEALNFGCGGYGTDQGLLRFREQAQLGRIEGHVATLGIMLENIGRNVNRYRPLYYPQSGVAFAKPRFVLNPDDTLRLIPLPFDSFTDYLDHIADGSVLDVLAEHEHWSDTQGLGVLRHLATARLAAGFFAYRARAHRSLWEDRQSEPVKVTIALLRAFYKEALAAGATQALILIFPATSDLEALLDEGSAYWQHLNDALTAADVPFVDCSTALAAACRSEGRSAGSCYAGGHLNSAANAVVSKALLGWLEQALPEPRRPARR